ncbi:hemolysin III family protein [uncultured Intestinimonas sp.]|uniref:PAQR family membrane homeostasis protein TrhA n=1 Tax=uncultured Intestinimonas sp. TaxID=1689265 RepID=UPI0025EFD1C2|nr:hemolysin III family protein [uncultured Intestinimonas sp.]
MNERMEYNPYAFARPKVRPCGEKARDPYDGLRPWSAITHGMGAALGVLGTVLLLWRVAALNQGGAAFGAFLLYGLSMIGLYTASTLYHCLRTGVKGRIALRKYDHISIYFLIAGSYTPICALMLVQDGGIPMLAAVWTVALAGTALAVAWISAPRWLTSAIYLLMGWMALFLLPGLLRNMPVEGMLWLVLGGVLYTVGGVLYAVKWPGRNNPRFGCHEIFHVFILLGSVAHFFLMYRVVAIS